MPEVKRLEKLEIDESSGVDRPANLSPGWVVIKNDATTSGTATTASFTMKAKTKSPHPFKPSKEDPGQCAACGQDKGDGMHYRFGKGMAPHAFTDKNADGKCDVCGMTKPQHDAAAAAGPPKKVSKAGVRMAWKRANPGSTDIPAVLKNKEGPLMPPDINRDDLADDVLELVTDLESRLAKAEADLATKPEPPKADPAVTKGEIPEAVQKALDESDRLRKAAEDKATEMEKSVTAANERLAKMERKEREGEYIAKARDLGNLSTSAPTLGNLLLDISEAVPETTFKSLEQLLKAANAQLEKGALFATIGDAEGETAADTTLDARVTKAAVEMVAKGLAPTVEQAKLAVLKSDPALREEYDTARRAR